MRIATLMQFLDTKTLEKQKKNYKETYCDLK